MIKAVLFDLDGTLLPMDQDAFVARYLEDMAIKMAPLGYEGKRLGEAIWEGVYAMARNESEKFNKEVYWDVLASYFGEDCRKDEPMLMEFYQNEFQLAKIFCGFNPQAADAIALVKEKGWMAVLATNPVFPAVATEHRIRWAGIQPEDFVLYTTYENSRSAKPSLAYYRQILDKLHLKPEECIMVGNDTRDDIAAEKLGIPVFLLTDYLINRDGMDISAYPHGGYEELLDYLRNAQ